MSSTCLERFDAIRAGSAWFDFLFVELSPSCSPSPSPPGGHVLYSRGRIRGSAYMWVTVKAVNSGRRPSPLSLLSMLCSVGGRTSVCSLLVYPSDVVSMRLCLCLISLPLSTSDHLICWLIFVLPVYAFIIAVGLFTWCSSFSLFCNFFY